MPALRPNAIARSGSRRRWIPGAVIAAALLAAPRVADPDRAPDPGAACDRSTAAPHRGDPAPVVPIGPTIEPTTGQGAASAVGVAGASRRPALHHMIGL